MWDIYSSLYIQYGGASLLDDVIVPWMDYCQIIAWIAWIAIRGFRLLPAKATEYCGNPGSLRLAIILLHLWYRDEEELLLFIFFFFFVPSFYIILIK